MRGASKAELVAKLPACVIGMAVGGQVKRSIAEDRLMHGLARVKAPLSRKPRPRGAHAESFEWHAEL